MLSASEENEGLAKEEKMEMLSFYVEGDRKADSMLYNFEAFTCRGQPESI